MLTARAVPPGRLPRHAGGAPRSTAGRQRGLSRATAILAGAAIAAAAVLAHPAPASAGVVRDSEAWVLSALNIQPAWNVTEGKGVIVAVIDSGVDPAVSDLSGQVIQRQVNFSGVNTPPSNPNWGVHGTWMASLIAGHGHGLGDSSGILGTAPQARILSIRVITDTTDPNYQAYQKQPAGKGQHELAEAIRYAVGHGAKVISMSLGYSLPSRQVRLALQDAYRHDVVVVASAGNSGDAAGASGTGHAPYSFPANYPGVLAVGAVDSSFKVTSFSSENLSVQVAAPGDRVPAQGRDGQYWYVSGTSPACALTAGVVALIKARYPGLTDPQVISAITSSTRLRTRPSGGYDQQIGFGMVNAGQAMAAAGRLARSRPATAGMIVAGHFGGGAAAIPAAPIAPRGSATLILLCLLAAAGLALVAYGSSRLLSSSEPTMDAPAPPSHAASRPRDRPADPGSTASGPAPQQRYGESFRLPGYTASGHGRADETEAGDAAPDDGMPGRRQP